VRRPRCAGQIDQPDGPLGLGMEPPKKEEKTRHGSEKGKPIPFHRRVWRAGVIMQENQRKGTEEKTRTLVPPDDLGTFTLGMALTLTSGNRGEYSGELLPKSGAQSWPEFTLLRCSGGGEKGYPEGDSRQRLHPLRSRRPILSTEGRPVKREWRRCFEDAPPGGTGELAVSRAWGIKIPREG